MKLLSITIPCYNSASYLKKCIDSLLPGKEAVEIIIVNDGSTDGTSLIAHEYEKNYPGIIKVIDKENGGHGSAINAGLNAAEGLFFKVVDSDDWVSPDALMTIIETLRQFSASDTVLDMLISNFIYEKSDGNKKVIRFNHSLPVNSVFTWNEVKRFPRGHFLLMHALLYRTALLRDSRLTLPEHSFYVDNIFAFEPLPAVKNIYYLNEDFYHYSTGREDQSVNARNMIARIDQQIAVNKRMFDFMLRHKDAIFPEVHLKTYMLDYLDVITAVSSIFLILSKTSENLAKKEMLWKYIEDSDKDIYKRLRFGLMGSLVHLPGKIGREFSIGIYHFANMIFKFN